MPDHVKQIESQILALRKHIDVLAGPRDFEELLKIIHFPGYTTPAEFTLVLGTLERMGTLVSLATQMKATVLKASQQIVEKR
jgi:hypothetical protein